ncbi:MAG: GNAT family N-acetyltransferase [Chitinophagaceae bacterium]|nr:MAG: GNAT family N-acetyltransferase [Chitinophagaceae bacterium]
MKNIEVKEYSEEFHRQWDDFIRTSSRNGGIFQERDFLSYHAEGKFNDASLLFFEEGELISVFPAAIITDNGNEKIVSHPGSSCGGLIYHNTATLKRVLEILQLLIGHYRSKNISSIEMHLAEPVFHSMPEGELTFLLWHRGFTLKTQEISSCIRLSNENSWEKLGRKKNLTDIRKLEREGYTVKTTDEAERIYPLIESNQARKYKRKPTHTLDELKMLKQIYPGRIHFHVAEINDTIAAVTVLFDVTSKAVHTFYIAQAQEFASINVFPFMFYKIFEQYQQQGFDWYNFGISSRGQEIKWGMLEFKERTGGRATTRQVWILENLSNYKKFEE